jgi:transcription elongation factor GreA
MEKETYLSRARFIAYQKELEFLETVGVKKVAKYLGSATGSGMGRPAFGPAAELDRDFQYRINELKSKLRTAHIIEEEWKQTDMTGVFIGATVTLYNLSEGETVQYTIVGVDDVNVEQGLISYLSPVGSALLGHGVGDVIEIQVRKDSFLQYRVDNIKKLPIEIEVPESPIRNRIRRLD